MKFSIEFAGENHVPTLVRELQARAEEWDLQAHHLKLIVLALNGHAKNADAKALTTKEIAPFDSLASNIAFISIGGKRLRLVRNELEPNLVEA